MADLSSFLKFVRTSRLPFIPDEYDFGRRVRFTAENKAEFLSGIRDGYEKVVDSFDFSPFFPFDNGEEPPYFRKRTRVDRNEAGMFFRYRAVCKRKGVEAGDFKPYPLPDKEQLEAAYNDNWPFD